MSNPSLHNLYRDNTNRFGPDTWIHSIQPIIDIRQPNVASNFQNKKLGVNGSKKINRCNICTKPKNRCNCKNEKKYAQPSYANSPDPSSLPVPTQVN